MKNFYELELLGLKRNLPILPTPSGIMIAGFNPVGDTELLEKSAKDLFQKLEENKIPFDVILTTELKGIPIAQEIARLAGKDYVCLRKNKKCYMLSPTEIGGESITSGKTKYYISSIDLEKLTGKNVLFADDVFSTGSTLLNMFDFAKKENFKITSGVFILKEAPNEQDKKSLEFDYFGTKILCSGFLPLQ